MHTRYLHAGVYDLPNFPISRLCRFLSILCLSFLAAGLQHKLQAEETWRSVGPDGGDARSLAADPGDPSHLYLGTTHSWLYESTDGGASWHRLAKLQESSTLVLDHIVVDPSHRSTLYVSGWQTGTAGGGIWASHDSGRTWSELAGMRGQSVFAFAQAPSDPKYLYAGTFDGVYRSTDAGSTWTQISPPGSHEIHDVESLAVDPGNAEIVYVGTWHLPWKTTDGGKKWTNIKEGLIVDSDIFSIVLDPQDPSTIYMSACSGIYKSKNAGALFSKIQGIPTEARRTRVLMQDPENLQVVYAGTTQGLYKTENAGKTFRLMTSPDLIVNDVFVDPRNSKHVMLATDRSGVLVSQDGGETFAGSNAGVSERKVESLLVDSKDAKRLYAGVLNDKAYGGVFVSTDGGARWAQTGAGLDGRDVFALAETKDGTVVAGTNDGIFVLDPPAPGAATSELTWEPRNTIANTTVKTVTETVRSTRVSVEKQVKVPVFSLGGRINALDVSGDVWVAAANYGLLTSSDQGASWQGGPVMGAGEYLTVAVNGKNVAAARADGAVLSQDQGKTWWPMTLPTMVTRIHRLMFSPDGTLWMGAREGVYFTHDLGKSWLWLERLPFRDVYDLSYEPGSQDAGAKGAAPGRILASSRSSDQIFAIDPKTMSWDWWQTGYNIALIRAAGSRLVAVSLDEGVVVGPQADRQDAKPQKTEQSASLAGK
jgi:photosystem II stability/assembly factor-like uncharacterized protein